MTGNEKLYNFFLKSYFFIVWVFIDPFHRYHYIRYFIYSGCMWRNVCTTCNSVIFTQSRRSRSQMFFKISVLKNFAILLEPLFVTCSFIKKRLQHRCFTLDIAKFLRTASFIEHLQWLLLMVYRKKLFFL